MGNHEYWWSYCKVCNRKYDASEEGLYYANPPLCGKCLPLKEAELGLKIVDSPTQPHWDNPRGLRKIRAKELNMNDVIHIFDEDYDIQLMDARAGMNPIKLTLNPLSLKGRTRFVQFLGEEYVTILPRRRRE